MKNRDFTNSRNYRGMGIRITVCLLIIFSICVRLNIPCEAKDRVELNISSATMKLGTSRKLNLRYLTFKQKKQVRWKSSKKTVVSVTKNGKIKAKGKGKAVISAIYKKKKYQCVVRVVAPNAKEYVTEGTTSYRGFTVDSVLHSAKNGNIHFNVYFPKSYDGTKPYALFVTLPGYQGLYFQGAAENIKTEDFGFTARKYNSQMIILAPQLSDWEETSANQTIALVEYFISHYNIDTSKIYADGYSAGGETLSLALGKRPELFTACLLCNSQWEGKYDSVIRARVPVYLVIGKNDEYFGSKPFKETYRKLYNHYQKQGMTKKEISKLLVLDVKGDKYFSSQGVEEQHAGVNLYSRDKKIMRWLFSK